LQPMNYLLRLLLKYLREEPPHIVFIRVVSFLIIQIFAIYHLAKYNYELKYKNLSQFIQKEVHGSQMMIDMKDKGLCRDLYIIGSHEPYLTEWVKENLKLGMIHFDIGANIGYYALLAAHQGCKVYAVEPVKESYELLNLNAGLNHYPDFRTFNLAIGDRNGKCKVYWGDVRNWATLIPANVEFSNIATVPIRTLDNFITDTRWPDVVRMDVEGYEYEIIKGATNLLQSKKPLILIIEMHYYYLKEKAHELLDSLRNNGFEVAAVFEEPYPFVENHRRVSKLLSYLYGMMGTTKGPRRMGYKELYNLKFMLRQIYVEVVFQRR